ncbi:hypothetical protein Tco_0436555 [Tanacetum coccineum]
MIKILQNIDREDLETLWKLVKSKHGNTRPKEAHERVLWGDLKVMFEPDIESDVWRNIQGHKVEKPICLRTSKSQVQGVFDEGLLEGVNELLPNAEHRKCTRHLFANYKKKVEGQGLVRGRRHREEDGCQREEEGQMLSDRYEQMTEDEIRKNLENEYMEEMLLQKEQKFETQESVGCKIVTGWKIEFRLGDFKAEDNYKSNADLEIPIEEPIASVTPSADKWKAN